MEISGKEDIKKYLRENLDDKKLSVFKKPVYVGGSYSM